MKKQAKAASSHKSCPQCKHQMLTKEIEYAYWHEKALVAVVQNVPAWVCQLCSHRTFDPAVETTIKFLVKDYISLGQTYPIPSTLYRSSPGLARNN